MSPDQAGLSLLSTFQFSIVHAIWPGNVAGWWLVKQLLGTYAASICLGLGVARRNQWTSSAAVVVYKPLAITNAPKGFEIVFRVATLAAWSAHRTPGPTNCKFRDEVSRCLKLGSWLTSP